MVKQAILAGRTAGLRPSQKRRLERLCHRRHPDDQVAELLCLQRLAGESSELELPLTLVVDGRGLCRLLWVGPLEQSGRLLERLPGSDRRQGTDLRLLTCCGRTKQLQPGRQEGIVGLDLAPRLWLRFGDQPQSGGQWPAQLFMAQPDAPETYYDASFSVSYAENDVLSVYLRASWYCGGPYPTNGANHSVTFDMQTGEEVAFADLFDRYVRNRSAIAATIFAEQIQKYDGPEDGQSCNGMYSLRFENDQPTLFSFADDLAYRIEGGDVVAEPIFPHVIAACAEEGRASAASLSKFFASGSLLSRVR